MILSSPSKSQQMLQLMGLVQSPHIIDGNEHPIAFASHTLTSSDHNYVQVEKEALALIFAVKKFHTYLYGRNSCS